MQSFLSSRLLANLFGHLLSLGDREGWVDGSIAAVRPRTSALGSRNQPWPRRLFLGLVESVKEKLFL